MVLQFLSSNVVTMEMTGIFGSILNCCGINSLNLNMLPVKLIRKSSIQYTSVNVVVNCLGKIKYFLFSWFSLPLKLHLLTSTNSKNWPTGPLCDPNIYHINQFSLPKSHKENKPLKQCPWGK